MGRLPTCSSPVRHVKSPKTSPFDLHALGTPPALILSQDQTLHHCFTLLLFLFQPDAMQPTPKDQPTNTQPPQRRIIAPTIRVLCLLRLPHTQAKTRICPLVKVIPLRSPGAEAPCIFAGRKVADPSSEGLLGSSLSTPLLHATSLSANRFRARPSADVFCGGPQSTPRFCRQSR